MLQVQPFWVTTKHLMKLAGFEPETSVGVHSSDTQYENCNFQEGLVLYFKPTNPFSQYAVAIDNCPSEKPYQIY